MTADEPDDTDRIAEALAWLDETPHDQRGGRAVPALRKRFKLSTREAIETIRAHGQRMARSGSALRPRVPRKARPPAIRLNPDAPIPRAVLAGRALRETVSADLRRLRQLVREAGEDS